jgi:hypothetical protein
VARDRAVSSLLLDELFSSEDEQFVPTLLRSVDPGDIKPLAKRFADFAEKWKRDPRPWAREQVFRCLDAVRDQLHGAYVAGTSQYEPLWLLYAARPLLKRLYKHFEAAGDTELVGAFAVLFDAMVRRRVRKRYRYDWRTCESWEEESLRLRPMYGGFSYHTRYYLRRRAWRYFRRMGFQRSKDYCVAVADILRRYRDGDLTSGLDILDSWTLVHACFGKREVLDFSSASHVRLKPGRDLGELSPAPYFLKLWQEAGAVPALLSLVEEAGARLVRVWAIGLLRRQHGRKLAGITVDHIVRLLDHADEEVQQFGAELLDGLEGLATLPVETWLRLLGTKNLTALQTIVDLMRRNVAGDRLGLETVVELAIAKAAPVARLGVEYLKSRKIATADEAGIVARLASAKAAAVAGELAMWALGILGEERFYDVDHVVGFFDSLQRSARDATWEWLLGPKSEISDLKFESQRPPPQPSPGVPGEGERRTSSSLAYDDPALWSRLLESPFDDCRLRLVEVLRARTSLPGQKNGRLTALWCGVLLNVHRGGRHKVLALRQVSDALVEDPGRAETLLPVLAVALRSVRAPEARAGLAALVHAADLRPDIVPLVERYLPEVQLIGEVEACS